MAKGLTMQNDRYYCPTGGRRTTCACPDCLEWRYQELKAGAKINQLRDR